MIGRTGIGDRAASWLAIGLLLAVGHLAAAEVPAGVKFSRHLLMVSPNEGCAVADVNKDGVPDVIAGPNWFAGPDYVPRPLRDIPEFQNDYLKNNGDHAYDVDGDGWIDVISGDWMSPSLKEPLVSRASWRVFSRTLRAKVQ